MLITSEFEVIMVEPIEVVSTSRYYDSSIPNRYFSMPIITTRLDKARAFSAPLKCDIEADASGVFKSISAVGGELIHRGFLRDTLALPPSQGELSSSSAAAWTTTASGLLEFGFDYDGVPKTVGVQVPLVTPEAASFSACEHLVLVMSAAMGLGSRLPDGAAGAASHLDRARGLIDALSSRLAELVADAMSSTETQQKLLEAVLTLNGPVIQLYPGMNEIPLDSDLVADIGILASIGGLRLQIQSADAKRTHSLVLKDVVLILEMV
jgi:hypothetical protein